MSFLNNYFKGKFGVDYDKLTKIKKIAFNTFNAFNKIVEPEIKTSWLQTIWSYLRTYGASKIVQKPDAELYQDLILVIQEIKPLLDNVTESLEIQKAEALGAIKIPRLGELKRKIEVVDLKEVEKLKEASKILAELMMK